MTAIIESSTTAMLSLALSASTMRQQAIAHNIANVNTPNFTPVGVSFDARFAQARAAMTANGGHPLPNMADYQPAFELAAPDSAEGGPVSLDVQVANLSQNVLHHQALLKALNKHFAILGMAVTEGKR